MLPPILPFFNKKTILRARMKTERRAAANARPDAARHAAQKFVAHISYANDDVIALYCPIRDELSTEPLIDALAESAVTLALPVIVEKKAPLIFRAFAPGDALIDGAYGAQTPNENAAEVTPTIVLAPLLAFTRRGDRLGYGGGYYDRTLAALRQHGPVAAVGFAYGAQEVDALPLSPLDQPLDWIVTEREAIRCS